MFSVRIRDGPQIKGAVAETVEFSYSAWSEKPETGVRIPAVPLKNDTAHNGWCSGLSLRAFYKCSGFDSHRVGEKDDLM